MTKNTLPIKLTYQEILDRYQEETDFIAWVDHNPHGEGKRTKLEFRRFNQFGDVIGSWAEGQKNIDGVDYYYGTEWNWDYTGLFEIVEEEPDETQEITKPTPAKEKVQEINIIGVTFHDGKYSLTATYEAHPSGTLITMKGLNDHFLFCKSKGDLATIVVRLMKKATDFIPEATKIMNN